MAQKNVSQVIESSPFLQQHSVLIRIWHWATFLIISGSMITVLINATMLNPRDNITLVQNQLKAKGVIATDEQAFAVSHQYEDKMWDVHKLFGYGLAFLLVSRLILELLQPKEEKLRYRFKNAMNRFKLNDGNSVQYRHYLYVKRLYLLFYLILLVMAITGLDLAFGHEFGFTRQTHNALKTIHSLFQYFMYGFIFIHICGVFIAENSKDKGIVSGMINGNNSLE
jgi:cytochrome b